MGNIVSLNYDVDLSTISMEDPFADLFLSASTVRHTVTIVPEAEKKIESRDNKLVPRHLKDVEEYATVDSTQTSKLAMADVTMTHDEWKAFTANHEKVVTEVVELEEEVRVLGESLTIAKSKLSDKADELDAANDKIADVK